MSSFTILKLAILILKNFEYPNIHQVHANWKMSVMDEHCTSLVWRKSSKEMFIFYYMCIQIAK